MKIYGIQTKDGVLLSEKLESSYSSGTSLGRYFFNGEKPTETFHKDWVKVTSTPIKIEQTVSQKDINHRYELIDKEMESEKTPLVFMREDIAEYDDDEYEWYWKEDFRHLRSLYRVVSDKQPDSMKGVEFEYEQIAEVDEIKSSEGFQYTVLSDPSWNHKGTTELTESSVHHQLIDKIIFPNILLMNKPSKLTSTQMFEIVRQHVKQNIDLKVAKITSDYKFCFTVKKVISISDPYEQKTEIMKQNGRPYKSPKYNRRFIRNREVEIFEMTHSQANYDGYTSIPAMIGENIEDLKEKVDKYCKQLIDVINKPLVDCSHCDGRGVLVEGSNPKNNL